MLVIPVHPVPLLYTLGGYSNFSFVSCLSICSSLMRTHSRLAVLALGLSFGVACSQPAPELREPRAIEPPRVGEAAPEFSLASTDGEDLALTDFRGRSPVLLYFSMGPG